MRMPTTIAHDMNIWVRKVRIRIAVYGDIRSEESWMRTAYNRSIIQVESLEFDLWAFGVNRSPLTTNWNSYFSEQKPFNLCFISASIKTSIAYSIFHSSQSHQSK